MYPKITDINFQKKLVKYYSKYKISNKKRSFNELCFPKEYTLQQPQKFLSSIYQSKYPIQKNINLSQNWWWKNMCSDFNS